MTTKADIINRAYSELRISGFTVGATPEELELALYKLEDMAAEYEGINIDVGYNFEETPDINSPHNIERKFWASYSVCLAGRLIGDFGKQLTPTFQMKYQAAYSYLSARTAKIKEIDYPSRQPMESKNRFKWNYEQAVPVTANIMYVGDIDDFYEDYNAWLNDSETISSYTIEADDGLTVVSDSNTDTQVSYQIEADSAGLNEVKIVTTSSDSRVVTRIINFQVKSAEI